MAKFSYSKPAITFQAIPLVVGGGTGCFYNPSATGRNCVIEDTDLGITIFSSDNSACEYGPADGDNICYTVPLADANIYNS